jgi:hypothetical protein
VEGCVPASAHHPAACALARMVRARLLAVMAGQLMSICAGPKAVAAVGSCPARIALQVSTATDPAGWGAVFPVLHLQVC